jgi:hypothetical protein
MRKLFILFILLAWTVLPLAPAKAAAAPTCAQPAGFRLDGVELSLCLPFAVGAFRLPEPDNKIQVATGEDASGQGELAITAMPLGTRPSSEILPVLQTGQEQSYRDQLQDFRVQQGGVWVGSPQLSLFGQSVSGATNMLTLAADGVHPQPVQISEWLAEAGGRIWLVRLSENLSQGGANPLQPQSIPAGISLSALNPDAPSTSLSSLQAVPPAATSLPAPQAVQTNLPAPAWWNGDCDTVNYQVRNPGHPAYPLGASYLGMKACGPRFFDYRVDTLIGFYPGAYGQFEWECVELSMRFMYLAYGVPPYGANGNQVVSAYRGSRLKSISNKTVGKAPQPGDVLSYGISTTVGHTSVVTASNVNAYGNGTISIIEQNDSASGARSHDVTNWNVIDSMGVIGWLHDPTYDNQLPPVVTFSPLNPAPNAWYHANQSIAFSSSDYVGLWGYSQAWDADPGGSVPQVTSSASGSAGFSGLREGQHTLYVRVWDNLPAHNSQVYTTGWYGLDTTSPQGKLGSFLDGATITTRSLPLDVSPLADSGGSGLGHARITAFWAGHSAVEVVSNITAAGTYAWDLCVSGVPDGQLVSLSLDVWDQAGNVSLAAGGVRHFVKNYACSTPVQVHLDGPTSLTPLYTGAANECTHYWKQFTDLNNHPAYLTLNADTAAHSTNSARWTPSLPAAGQYRVEAFIPHHTYYQLCNTFPPGYDSANASYLIQYQGGSTSVAVNQQSYSDQWADLGSYSFAAGAAGSVELSDLTGETKLSRYVVFSELRFTPLAAPATCFGINVGIFPAGSAGIAVTPPNCGDGQYTPGTVVQLTLKPQPGMTFNRWEGGQGGWANPISMVMDGDKAVVAYFSYANLIYLPLMGR